MDDSAYEPENNHALATCLEDSFTDTKRLREGGWDGPRIAAFIATLAETGIVTYACRACGMSAKSAYALRHRDPIFAGAWEAALAMARVRLADELLARSLKGSHEALLRDGAIVAERQHYDNKLAFSILRRLDRRAELGSTFGTPAAWERPRPVPAASGQWQDLLDALTEDRRDDAGALLAPEDEQGNTGGNDPLFEDEDSDSLDGECDIVERVWRLYRTDHWLTDFPPPPGFAGTETGCWGEAGYSRTLSGEEMAALADAGLAGQAEGGATIEQDAIDRDQFFSALRAEAQQAKETEPRQATRKAKSGRPS